MTVIGHLSGGPIFRFGHEFFSQEQELNVPFVLAGDENGRVVGFVKYMKNVIENKWYIGTGLRFKIGIDDIRGAIHKQ